MTELSKFASFGGAMSSPTIKHLDAILANVEMTMVTSVPNISKTAGGSRGSFQQI